LGAALGSIIDLYGVEFGRTCREIIPPLGTRKIRANTFARLADFRESVLGLDRTLLLVGREISVG
jgi:hypothetical protein